MGSSHLNSFLAGLLFCALAASSSSVATAEDTRLPVPDGPAQAEAHKLIREVFKAEYAALTPATRPALARRMIQQAGETSDDVVARFVLLREAIDLATAGGEAPVAITAADRLAGLYRMDELDLKSTALLAASTNARRASDHEVLARACLAVLDLSIARDDYDIATRMVYLSETAATRSKAADLATLCADRRKETAAIKVQFEEARSAMLALDKTPDDAKARLAAGRFLCLIKGQWDRGLPLLAGCSDPGLRSAAEADLAAADDAGGRLAAANAWWNLAEKNTGLARRNLQWRSAMHYRTALPSLTGINQKLAEGRLAQLDEQRLKDLHLKPGLRAELFDDIKLSHLVATRIDKAIEFDWGTDAPAENLPKDNFAIRWTGQLNVPRKGQYTLVVNVNSGVRIFLGGKQVLDELDGTHKRSGVKAALSLKEGLQPIRIEYWDTGGEAKIKLQWIMPGETRDTPIPANAFCHDPAEGM